MDSHAHIELDSGFLDSIKSMCNADSEINKILVFSNSVDLESSKRNIELAKTIPCIFPFVGIHPQSLQNIAPGVIAHFKEDVLEKLQELIPQASGIGEIGLDPKYGNLEFQKEVLQLQLELAEKRKDLPITIHSRETTTLICDLLSVYNISNRILFHWFSGTEQELSKLSDLGIYVSFGPALLFSKRLSGLYLKADKRLVLSETDSPLVLRSLQGHEVVSPFVVASVLFKMAELENIAFEEIVETIYLNSSKYLRAQNSLSIKRD